MADREVRRPVYQCPCEFCRRQPVGRTALDHQAINRVLASLDERQRRLFAGLLAQRRGHGGILIVAEITGLSRTTIRRGREELRTGVGPAEDRMRGQGGGRKRVEKKRPPW
jgi:hypothetical protein